MPAKIPKHVRVEQILNFTEAHGYQFNGWVGEYSNNASRMTLKCPRHGEWVTTVNSIVDYGRKCRKCADEFRRVNLLDVWGRLSESPHLSNCAIVGLVGEYKGYRTRVMMQCSIHGVWKCQIGRAIHKGTGCPGCADYGYNPTKPGTVYAVSDRTSQKVKIGISNNFRRRLVDLRRDTPFEIVVLRELSFYDGSIPPVLERQLHDRFPSAGLTGFNGATEWRVWHDDVHTWFELLGA